MRFTDAQHCALVDWRHVRALGLLRREHSRRRVPGWVRGVEPALRLGEIPRPSLLRHPVHALGHPRHKPGRNVDLVSAVGGQGRHARISIMVNRQHSNRIAT